MPAVTELDELLSSMKPQLLDIEFVFCTVSGSLAEYVPSAKAEQALLALQELSA